MEQRAKNTVKVKVKIFVQFSLSFMKSVIAVTADSACAPNVNKICNVLQRNNA